MLFEIGNAHASPWADECREPPARMVEYKWWTPDETARMLRMKEQGLTLRQIGVRLNRTRMSVWSRYRLVTGKRPRRPNWKPHSKWWVESGDAETLRTLWLSGHSIEQLCEALPHRSKQSIMRRLHKEGFVRSQKAEAA